MLEAAMQSFVNCFTRTGGQWRSPPGSEGHSKERMAAVAAGGPGLERGQDSCGCVSAGVFTVAALSPASPLLCLCPQPGLQELEPFSACPWQLTSQWQDRGSWTCG